MTRKNYTLFKMSLSSIVVAVLAVYLTHPHILEGVCDKGSSFPSLVRFWRGFLSSSSLWRASVDVASKERVQLVAHQLLNGAQLAQEHHINIEETLPSIVVEVSTTPFAFLFYFRNVCKNN